MNFSSTQVTELRSILSTCKSVGIDAVVFAAGKVMGANDKRTLAIISESLVVPAGAAPIGVGRITELSKRLDLFGDDVSIDGKEGQKGEMSQLTLSSGRTKAQFRCTSTSMIPHPKSNEDPPHCVVTLTPDEAKTLHRAIKTFAAEVAVIRITAGGEVHIECSDSTNDQYSTVLSTPAEFVGEAETVLFTYAASNLSTALEAGARESEAAELVVGEAGSITAMVKDRSVVIIPNANEE
jgi:hypothetical protein